jgi:glycosyltransferase involved in cell wall biosynthesis
VLVLFGSVPLLGQERGNIQVFHALRRSGVDALFVTNRTWGHLHVRPLLDSLGLKWTDAIFLRRFTKGMGFLGWIRNIACISSASITLWMLLRKYKPTHIHVFNVNHFLNFLPALLTTRVPIIYRLGDAPEKHRRLFRVLWKRILIPKTCKFVCVSHHVKSLLMELGAPEMKCSVIYSEAPARPSSALARSSRCIEKRRAFTVLYVGQLSREKGVHVFVDAAMQLCRSDCDIEFLIAGDYEWQNEFAVALKRNVEAAGMDAQIRFLGYVNDVQDLFEVSDIHVLPSLCQDALPNVVVEAKEAGVASVVFSSGGVPELIAHDIDGFICRDTTTESLISAIRCYVDAPSRAACHGRNAKSSLERLSINRFRELWGGVYADS